ncbi:MAG TPA: hypothetical protein P5234_11820 [Thermoanaerobaculaceae bacterium]|nr:hypothetical protein [Thermoanaerobaculaceae bacterium]HRS16920.1 hypothetical protein [Thermoanaerobaculaceae bacterium]
MSKTIEHEWEIELPAATPEQLLAALAARDRLFGQSVTLEPEEDAENTVEVWFGAAEALDDDTFHLAVYAELSGAQQYLDAARDALEDIVGEQIEMAATEAAEAALLETRKASEIEFRPVSDDEQRPQLIIPEWLGPQGKGVEMPWGFRAFGPDGRAWPDDDMLSAHDRLVILPVGDELRLYTLPPIEEEDADEE